MEENKLPPQIWFKSEYGWCLGDKDLIGQSERTFDMTLNNFAIMCNDQFKLPGCFTLGHRKPISWHIYTEQEKIDMMAFYLSAFKDEGKDNSYYEYLKTNPELRLLITDEKLLKEYKKRIQ